MGSSKTRSSNDADAGQDDSGGEEDSPARDVDEDDHSARQDKMSGGAGTVEVRQQAQAANVPRARSGLWAGSAQGGKKPELQEPEWAKKRQVPDKDNQRRDFDDPPLIKDIKDR